MRKEKDKGVPLNKLVSEDYDWLVGLQVAGLQFQLRKEVHFSLMY